MSELAKNEHGEEWTAFMVKDEYLRSGTMFRWFVCAYCDTEVSPAATYGDKFKKAPHFTLADRSKPHARVCPYGESTFSTYGITQGTPGKHDFDVALPERLVPIRQQRLVPATTNIPPKELATPEEIRRRVQTGRDTAAIANQYTTGLLKTLADARNAAMRAIRELPSIKALKDEKERTRKMFKRLEACPLNLYGQQLEYNSAFHKTNHIPWDGSYIYYGNATVNATTEGFLLISADEISGPTPSEKISAHVRVVCDKTAPANRMEARTIDRLTAAVAEGSSVRWYAYGELKLNDSRSAYEISIQQPAHIHV